jgi:type I restriction enzyme S subunit
MAKEGKSTVMPKLRFPEFRGSGEWKAERMEKLYTFMRNNALSRDKLNYEAGTVKNIHYGDIHTKFPVLFDITKECVPYVNSTEELPDFESGDYCVEGDIIFADASEDTNDVGKSIEIVRLNRERLLSGQHTILARRKDNTLIVGFGGYLFRSGPIRSQIQREAQGMKVYAISSTRLANIEIAYPADGREQQKIADCLASLDEVIATQGRKVAVLKAYKRGLMQHLFPGEGETLPRLRFPEFRREPTWALRKIGDVLEEITRPITMADDVEYSLVTVKRRYGGVVSRERLKGRAIKVKSQFIVRARDFLISKRQIVHNACGLVPPELAGSIVSNEYSVLAPKDQCDIEFFNYLSQQPALSASFLHSSVGIVIEKMLFKLNSWLKHEFLFPSIKEQRKIAGCLKAVEHQIAAEAEKLNALKTHKSGLMQQLFPSPEVD